MRYLDKDVTVNMLDAYAEQALVRPRTFSVKLLELDGVQELPQSEIVDKYLDRFHSLGIQKLQCSGHTFFDVSSDDARYRVHQALMQLVWRKAPLTMVQSFYNAEGTVVEVRTFHDCHMVGVHLDVDPVDSNEAVSLTRFGIYSKVTNLVEVAYSEVEVSFPDAG